MFKLTLITLLMTFSIEQIYGQERTNREKISFNKISDTLLTATGWKYNSTIGEWIDYNNVISTTKETGYGGQVREQLSISSISRNENFEKVQTKAITYEGITYYVLIVDKWNGQYKYPTIHEDWYYFKETIGYIYGNKEYQKLMNLENLIELKTKYRVSMGSSYEEYEETKFLDLIQTELENEKNKYSTEYTFPIMKSKEGAIRFRLPYNLIYKPYMDFAKEYFETDFNNFTKIILK